MNYIRKNIKHVLFSLYKLIVTRKMKSSLAKGITNSTYAYGTKWTCEDRA